MFARKPLGHTPTTPEARRWPVVAVGALFVFVYFLAALTMAAQTRGAEKIRLQVNSYRIQATVNPERHHLSARVEVNFTANEDLNVAIFELHNALRPTKVTDAEGHPMQVERVSQDSTVRVPLPSGLPKGQSMTLIFNYEGDLVSADDSPVAGLKLASIADPTSYLLYAGRWFPVSGYGINRFTSTIRITVPQGYTVIGSGAATTESAAPKPAGAQQSYTFIWDKPSFPGTLIIGKFEETTVTSSVVPVHVFFPSVHKQQAQEYGDGAGKEFSYFSTLYGQPLSTTLKVVELPDDTVLAAWAPEIAAISSRAVAGKMNYRLLANMIAHQWWGVSVSPATRNDWWITDGLARYGEAQYVDFLAGGGAQEEALRDMSVGALAYDTVPLGRIGTLDPFDPVFQSLASDKGGMVFHMFRWVVGNENFDKLERSLAQQFQGKPVDVDGLEKLAEQVTGEKLNWFFTQWLDSTGAPEFKNKYTIYRTDKGFRIVGEIQQDLDLFRMPVELKIDTDGQTETKKIDVAGTHTSYEVETFGKPRQILIDPANNVLKNSTDLRLRTSILRGQQLVQQGNLAESLREFQKALELNKTSSLAHYRIAEVFFQQHNYQAAANAYRDALNGDGEPRWTEVWCHLQLGKIFDITGQRERAVNEYRQALQTKDNTRGALDEARKYLAAPFSTSKQANGM